MSIVIVGIDLGKNSCSIVGLDSLGTVVVRRRLRRDGVIAEKAQNVTAACPICSVSSHAPSMGCILSGPPSRQADAIIRFCRLFRWQQSVGSND